MQSYVNAQVAGQTQLKNPVRVVALSNIALTGTPTIDGVAVAVGDRVLAAGQTTASQNGIYVVSAGAWSYATDVASTGQLIEGTEVLTAEGAAAAGAVFRLTSTGTIVPGTSTQTWTQSAQINTYVGDNTTITISGTTVSAKLDTAGWLTSSSQGIAADKSKVAGKYATTITGDGTTTVFTVTHSLNNRNCVASIKDSTWADVIVDWTANGVNTIQITFAVAPANTVAFNVGVVG